MSEFIKEWIYQDIIYTLNNVILPIIIYTIIAFVISLKYCKLFKIQNELYRINIFTITFCGYLLLPLIIYFIKKIIEKFNFKNINYKIHILIFILIIALLPLDLVFLKYLTTYLTIYIIGIIIYFCFICILTLNKLENKFGKELVKTKFHLIGLKLSIIIYLFLFYKFLQLLSTIWAYHFMQGHISAPTFLVDIIVWFHPFY